MKVLIFAGGAGRRLWPLSRQSSPKQFEPIIGRRSTLQLAVDRVLDTYGARSIYVSTNERYRDLVANQLPMLPETNLIGEPARRDLAAAVGLGMTHLLQHGDSGEPVAILWGDNYMAQVPTFLEVMATAEGLLHQREASIIFVGETPRFANENLGWIGLGEKKGDVDGRPYYGFQSLTYRPALEECRQMFAAETHVWNTGYFVTTPAFISAAYQKYQPEMWAGLAEIGGQIGCDGYQETLHRIYPQLEVLSFDDAILEAIDPAEALVLHGEMGWSDPGTLYALKEALSAGPAANVTQGLVVTKNVDDSLLYNFEEDKVMAVVGVDGLIVVNMEDVILVVHKDQIPLVKQLVNGLVGTDLEKYS